MKPPELRLANVNGLVQNLVFVGLWWVFDLVPRVFRLFVKVWRPYTFHHATNLHRSQNLKSISSPKSKNDKKWDFFGCSHDIDRPSIAYAKAIHFTLTSPRFTKNIKFSMTLGFGFKHRKGLPWEGAAHTNLARNGTNRLINADCGYDFLWVRYLLFPAANQKTNLGVMSTM